MPADVQPSSASRVPSTALPTAPVSAVGEQAALTVAARSRAAPTIS
jgi:hypothetical protein